MVQNYKTGELEATHYRISKSAWLQEHEHRHVSAVSRRVELMTSLSTETAEELQVVNYGIGGHYEPHFDFARVRTLPIYYSSISNYLSLTAGALVTPPRAISINHAAPRAGVEARGSRIIGPRIRVRARRRDDSYSTGGGGIFGFRGGR